jgi:hypothetical protein
LFNGSSGRCSQGVREIKEIVSIIHREIRRSGDQEIRRGISGFTGRSTGQEIVRRFPCEQIGSLPP